MGTGGISKKHFDIRVEADLTLQLYCHSIVAVECNRQNKTEVRRDWDWKLTSSPGEPPPYMHIAINVFGIAIEIEFPNHVNSGLQYQESLAKLLEAAQQGPDEDALKALQEFGIDSGLSTIVPSNAPTPRIASIYTFIGDPIGEGAYGEVWRVRHGSSGQVFAAKVFAKSLDFPRKRSHNAAAPHRLAQFRKEFQVVADIDHVGQCSSLFPS